MNRTKSWTAATARSSKCRRCSNSSARTRWPKSSANRRNSTNLLTDTAKGPSAMGVISRIANLWKGFLSIWISDIEKEHPEIAYENAINSMVTKYARLKSATAAIIRRREEIDERYQAATKELAQTEAELNTAVSTNQDDLAVILIQKKNQLTNDIADMKGEMETAKNDADSAKTSLLSVQTEIRKLKAERDTMLAKMQSAQARINIQEQLDGLSVDDEVKALETVRTHS